MRRPVCTMLLVGLAAVTCVVRADGPAAPATAPATAPTIPPLVMIQKGTIPIILLAPHGGTQVIPGAPVRKNDEAGKFVLGGDTRSAELCIGIADALEKELGGRPYVVVARFQRRFADANRRAEDAYESDVAKPHWQAYHAAVREACEDVTRQFGRGLVLDIHGQKLTPNGIYRGTRNGKSIQSLVAERGVEAIIGPESIFGALRAKGYKTLPEPEQDAIGKETDYSGNYSMVAYGSDTQPKIDAIQMEFGTEFRTQASLDKTANDAGSAIAIFARRYLPLKASK